MAAQHDHLVRLLAAPQLRDHVGGVRVGEGVGLHAQAHHDPPAARGQPLQSVGVLGGQRGGRDLGHARLVAQDARVGRAQTGRAHRADEGRPRAVPGRREGPAVRYRTVVP